MLLCKYVGMQLACGVASSGFSMSLLILSGFSMSHLIFDQDMREYVGMQLACRVTSSGLALERSAECLALSYISTTTEGMYVCLVLLIRT